MPSQTKIKTAPPNPGTRPVGFRAQTTQFTANVSLPSGDAVPKPHTGSTPVRTGGTNARNAPPMKKRAKGSGFLSVAFLIGFCGVGYFVWAQLLQFEAYGVIEGRVISVASPWDGTVTSWQVRDGEEVSQGQVLAQINNLDMQHELASLGDELKMNQALLDAEMSKIKFEVQSQTGRSQEAVAEYLKSYGELLSERAKFKELDRKFERTKRLAKSNNVSRSEYEQIFFQFAGQQKKVEKLQDAVDVLKIRSKEATLADKDGSSRLKPILAQIDLTHSKIKRLRERIDQGNIKAPVSGRVSKRHCLTGESTRDGEKIIDILEDNSVEAVLYVPQRIVDEFEEGEVIEFRLEPHRQPLRGTVCRFGDRFQTAPHSIQRFYYENQPLLPVYLTPEPDSAQLLSARVGGTVKRPYEYRKALGKIVDELKSTVLNRSAPADPNPSISNEIVPAPVASQESGFTEEPEAIDQAWDVEITPAGAEKPELRFYPEFDVEAQLPSATPETQIR